MVKRLDGLKMSKLFGWAIILALFGVLQTSQTSSSIENLIFSAYGSISVHAIQTAFPLLIWLLPLLVLNVHLGEHVLSQLDRHAVYIFTRTSNRKSWFLEQVFYLSLYTLWFHLILQGAIIVLGLLLGHPILSFNTFWAIIVHKGLLLFLISLISILLVNLLSIRIHAAASSALIMAYLIIVLYATGSVYHESPAYYPLLRWVPLTQGVYGWQVPLFTNIDNLDNHLSNGIFFAEGYLLIMCIAIIYFGVYRIARLDIY